MDLACRFRIRRVVCLAGRGRDMCGYSKAEADMKGAGEYGAGIRHGSRTTSSPKAGRAYVVDGVYIRTSVTPGVPILPHWPLGELRRRSLQVGLGICIMPAMYAIAPGVVRAVLRGK